MFASRANCASTRITRVCRPATHSNVARYRRNARRSASMPPDQTTTFPSPSARFATVRRHGLRPRRRGILRQNAGSKRRCDPSTTVRLGLGATNIVTAFGMSDLRLTAVFSRHTVLRCSWMPTSGKRAYNSHRRAACRLGVHYVSPCRSLATANATHESSCRQLPPRGCFCPARWKACIQPTHASGTPHRGHRVRSHATLSLNPAWSSQQ